MNDTTRLEIRPDVAEFLAKVRSRLSDLSEEQRDDLLGGLEADLSELVEDGGSLAELGDPRAYADELRSAAGVEPAGRRGRNKQRRPRRSPRQAAQEILDGSRVRWESLMGSRPWLQQSWEVVVTLRPAWWLLRAWVAVQVLDVALGPWEHRTLIPRFGDDVSGLALLLAASVVSVMIGLRKTWPASMSPRSVFARIVLLGLNSFAMLMLMVVVDDFPSSRFIHEWVHPAAMFRVDERGLVNDGRPVRNVFAYDADGQPLQGVQLFDQRGEPLAIDQRRVYRQAYEGRHPLMYPWYNGRQPIWNVYPLPLRNQDRGWFRNAKAYTSNNPPFLPTPPLASVPPIDRLLPFTIETPQPDAASAD